MPGYGKHETTVSVNLKPRRGAAAAVSIGLFYLVLRDLLIHTVAFILAVYILWRMRGMNNNWKAVMASLSPCRKISYQFKTHRWWSLGYLGACLLLCSTIMVSTCMPCKVRNIELDLIFNTNNIGWAEFALKFLKDVPFDGTTFRLNAVNQKGVIVEANDVDTFTRRISKYNIQAGHNSMPHNSMNLEQAYKSWKSPTSPGTEHSLILFLDGDVLPPSAKEISEIHQPTTEEPNRHVHVVYIGKDQNNDVMKAAEQILRKNSGHQNVIHVHDYKNLVDDYTVDRIEDTVLRCSKTMAQKSITGISTTALAMLSIVGGYTYRSIKLDEVMLYHQF